jgi:hypothetical protein
VTGLDVAAPLVADVWERLVRRADAYPPALRSAAERHRAGLVGSAYFSHIDASPLLQLPIWAAIDAGIEPRALLDVLEGAALAYWHVRIQDDVVDEPGALGRGDPGLLLLSNAYLWDAFALWSRVPDTELQVRSREAWLRFSELTESERLQVRGGAPYDVDAFRAHAGKVALAEIPLLAALSLSGRLDRGDRVRPLVHALGVAYGYLNDVVGVVRDLQAGQVTYLVSEARRQAGSDDDEAVRRTLVSGSLLEDFLACAAAAHLEAVPLASQVGLAFFPEWTNARVARIGELRARLPMLRLAAALGHAA